MLRIGNDYPCRARDCPFRAWAAAASCLSATTSLAGPELQLAFEGWHGSLWPSGREPG